MKIKSNISILLLLIFLTSCTSLGVINPDGTMAFKDASGKKHVMTVNPAVPKNPYNKESWKKDGDKMFYEGDARFRSRMGLDISRHDGNVDWQAVRAAGFEFVILRIGYRRYQKGTLEIDERFRENFKAARDAGLEIGVYIYSQAITEEEALEEAELVLEELKGEKLELPVVFDPENVPWEWARTDDISGEQFTKNSVVFCNRIKEAGYKPMIYANMLWEAFTLDLSRLSGIPLWYADYEDVPQSPYDFEFWQYSAFGNVPGCTEQRTDLDVQLIRVEK